MFTEAEKTALERAGYMSSLSILTNESCAAFTNSLRECMQASGDILTPVVIKTAWNKTFGF